VIQKIQFGEDLVGSQREMVESHRSQTKTESQFETKKTVLDEEPAKEAEEATKKVTFKQDTPPIATLL